MEKLNSNNSSFWNNSAQLTENITYPMAGVVVGTGIYQAFFAKKKDAFLLTVLAIHFICSRNLVVN
jgi:hypothetical protein